MKIVFILEIILYTVTNVNNSQVEYNKRENTFAMPETCAFFQYNADQYVLINYCWQYMLN